MKSLIWEQCNYKTRYLLVPRWQVLVLLLAMPNEDWVIESRS